MKEFYEPMLYLSTPDHPNTMGALVGLKEPVDGDILRGVVEELRARFPYYYVRAAAKENDLVPVPNPLHMTVRNSWDPINLNSEESNYHLAAWKYEGKRLAFEISHSLTDGAGMLPYIKSALYLYLSRKTGKNFDSTGFRLPGDDMRFSLPMPQHKVKGLFQEQYVHGSDPPMPTADACWQRPSRRDAGSMISRTSTSSEAGFLWPDGTTW